VQTYPARLMMLHASPFPWLRRWIARPASRKNERVSLYSSARCDTRAATLRARFQPHSPYSIYQFRRYPRSHLALHLTRPMQKNVQRDMCDRPSRFVKSISIVGEFAREPTFMADMTVTDPRNPPGTQYLRPQRRTFSGTVLRVNILRAWARRL
jgi:hypothetical protein